MVPSLFLILARGRIDHDGWPCPFMIGHA